jgi:Ca2+-transporting ATPase
VFVTVAGVVVIALDPGDPDVMHRPPRDPKVPIANRTAVISWIVYGFVLAAAAFIPLVAGPDEPSTSSPTASLTMTFVVMGLGTVFNALTNRRDPGTGLSPPILAALGVSLVPIAMIFLATQLPSLQKGLLTTSLTGPQWLAAIGLALALPIVIEASKWIRRTRAPKGATLEIEQAVAPSRAAA